MISNLMIVAVALCLLVLNVEGKHYCAEDSDCTALGDLVCTKSQCDWGICGCPRGQVARFVGSEMKFRCITLRKIGQSCSTSGTGGVCGPVNSACVDNICKCTLNRWPEWDGERCSDDDPHAGETCTERCEDAELGVICRLGGIDVTGGLQGLAKTCTCWAGQKVSVSTELGDTEFLGRSIPKCVPNVYGDFCLTNADCEATPGLACNLDTKRCDCENDTVKPTHTGECQLDAGKLFGEECVLSAPNDCNPVKNLVCGDVCDLTWHNDPDTYQPKCACASGYVREGADECIAVELNADCVGDYNCKSLGPNAQCVNGQCKSGSITTIGSIWIIAVGLIVSRWL